MPATSFLWQAVLLEGLIMSNYVFGIDLGTTNSCIAYVNEMGIPTVINNMEGTNTTPSVVNFAGPSEIVVGQIAKDVAYIDPCNTVSLVKTLMGQSSFAINYNGEDIRPEEVSAYILRKITNDASELLDTEVRDVVITCPAYFGSQEKIATKKACELAGLNIIEMLSEPVAAAISYGCVKEETDKTILVYDLGGATLDITVMKIRSGKIELICSDGDHNLGGKDWDTEVMNYLATQFCSETGFHGDFDEYAQQDLRLKAEIAKKQLSSKDVIPIVLDASGLRTRIMLSRTVFDEITQVLLSQTIEKTEAAIAKAESKGYKVDEILLVGGSTRMPQVKKAIVDKFGIVPRILEPEEAVAKGAAIYALDTYSSKLKQPLPRSSESYDIQIVSEGEQMSQSILLRNWQSIDSKECIISNCGSSELNIKIYERILQEDCDQTLSNELATVSFNSFSNSYPFVVEVKITSKFDDFNICCKELANGNLLSEVRFKTKSKLCHYKSNCVVS